MNNEKLIQIFQIGDVKVKCIDLMNDQINPERLVFVLSHNLISTNFQLPINSIWICIFLIWTFRLQFCILFIHTIFIYHILSLPEKFDFINLAKRISTFFLGWQIWFWFGSSESIIYASWYRDIFFEHIFGNRVVMLQFC